MSGDRRDDKLYRALRDNPNDRATRMVLADALEQRGETAKAEMLRLQESFDPDAPDEKTEKRLRVLAHSIDPEWRAQVARRPIDGCDDLQWQLKCPKAWESLAPVSDDDPDVRHCKTCDREVYFCTSMADVRMRGEMRQCVAFDASLIRKDARSEWESARHDLVMMGEVAVVEDPL
jgi:uncharacterized protein (TIGR02996 family)